LSANRALPCTGPWTISLWILNLFDASVVLCQLSALRRHTLWVVADADPAICYEFDALEQIAI